MALPQPPAQMIYDIAAGLEEPVEIASRYGYTVTEWNRLEEHQPFRTAVAQARSELEKGGHAVRTKARWMTEILIEDLFLRMKQEGTTVGQLQESVRILSKLGDLEPKPNVAAGPSGPTSSVQIIFSGGPAPEITIGGKDVSSEKEETVWDIRDQKPAERGILPGLGDEPD